MVRLHVSARPDGVLHAIPATRINDRSIPSDLILNLYAELGLVLQLTGLHRD